MDFFTQAKETVVKTADKVVKATGEAVDVTKANFVIAGIQSDIDEQYEQIGKAVYAARGGAADETAIEQACARLDELLQKLNEQKEHLRVLKKLAVCPKCGKESARTNHFCPDCGAPMQSEASATEDAE